MLAVITTNEKSHVDLELARHRPLRAYIDNNSNSTRVSDEVRRVRCLQVRIIFLDIHLVQQFLNYSKLLNEKLRKFHIK